MPNPHNLPLAQAQGLTDDQAASIELQLSLAPAAWRDGLLNDLLAAIDPPPPGPWTNQQVRDAVTLAWSNNGLSTSFLP